MNLPYRTRSIDSRERVNIYSQLFSYLNCTIYSDFQLRVQSQFKPNRNKSPETNFIRFK